MDKLFNATLYNECDYLFMLGFKLVQVSSTRGKAVAAANLELSAPENLHLSLCSPTVV